MKKFLFSAVLAMFLAVPFTSHANSSLAQIPCKDFLKLAQSEQVSVVVWWATGYLEGKEGEKAVTPDWQKAFAKGLVEYCAKNPDDKFSEAILEAGE